MQHQRPEVCIYQYMDLASGRRRVIEAGERFIRLGLEILGGDLFERVQEAAAAGMDLSFKSGRATGVFANVSWSELDEHGEKHEHMAPYSPGALESLMEILERLPRSAGISIAARGPVLGLADVSAGGRSLGVSWYRPVVPWAAPLPDWVILSAQSRFDCLLGNADRQGAMVEFVRRAADPANPAWAGVSYEPARVSGPPMEYLMVRQRPGRTPVAESRRVVPSYSWVTVVSEEIGQRLGGLDRLCASGAFHRVEHLSAGGFLLQATELFEQYGYEQAYRVFRTLAPVLPPGVPDAPHDDDPEFWIIREDPSDVLA